MSPLEFKIKFCKFEQYLAVYKERIDIHNFKFLLILTYCTFDFIKISIYVIAEHVRVVNGSNRCNGRVEVYHDGNWKRACSSDWRREEAEVLCKEVNCGSPVSQTEVPYFGDAHDLVGLKATCFGNETSLSKCRLQEFKESCVAATAVCTSKSTTCSNYISHFVVNLMRLDCRPFWMASE